MNRAMIWGFALLLACRGVAAPPEGFVVDKLGGSFSGVVGAAFLPDGALLAWEYGGKVWRVEADGTRQAQPVLDVSDEVGRWGDHGLLGLALHPNFSANGFVYLLYAVDREHLLRSGTAEYNPAANIPEQASISRLTRYQITAASGWRSVDLSSRAVLLGTNASDGFPLVNRCHGEGSLVFGEDGTLLVSFGDTASPWYVDHGVGGLTHDGYAAQAIGDGSLQAKSHVGAFRAQLVDDLSGKILRLDPDTGLGVRSNPFFDALSPGAPRSKVWALGLRNPFRMTRLPGTGSHDPDDANPGTLVVADVGWDDREELNLVTHGGMNLGWPLYEGITPMVFVNNNPGSPIFHGLRTVNQDAGASPSGCGIAFTDLLAPQGSSHWVDGCALTQAEDGVAPSALFARSHGGFSGRGYVDFSEPAGESLQVAVIVPTGGTSHLSVRYALGGVASRRMRVVLDGHLEREVTFHPSGRWDLWAWLTVPVPLSSGSHSLRLESIGESGPNVDGFVVHDDLNPAVLASALTARFQHTPPILDIPQPQTSAVPPRVPAASDTVPWRAVDDPLYPRISEPFTSECLIAGPVVQSHDWPAPWRDRLFIGDYTAKWIRGIELSADGSVHDIELFDPSAGVVMWLGTSPLDGQLYVARFSELVRIRHQPTGNRAPVAKATTSTPYGVAPLQISFDASATIDPDGDTLSFTWDFGDGTSASGPFVSHVFETPDNVPRKADVHLSVEDARGGLATTTLTVWPGNRPPQIELDEPHDGARYDASNPRPIRVEPSLFDPDGQPLSCEWAIILNHDSHTHPWGGPTECATLLELESTPCGDSTYSYTLMLTVKDSLGLATKEARTVLPRCVACDGDVDENEVVDYGDVALVLLSLSDDQSSRADVDRSGLVDFADVATTLLNFGPCN